MIWGTWASHVKSVDDASGVVRRVRREERPGGKGLEGRAKTELLEQSRAMVAKVLKEYMTLGSDLVVYGFDVRGCCSARNDMLWG